MPVGHIIESTNANFDPNRLYVGTTWEKIEGRFTLGSSTDYTLGSTGGSPDSVVVRHRHAVRSGQESGNYLSGDTNDYKLTGSGYTAYSEYEGVSGVGKNMPPYIVVNIWVRTA